VLKVEGDYLNFKNEIKQKNEKSSRMWKMYVKNKVALNYLLTMDKILNPAVVATTFLYLKVRGLFIK
ncbi:hypothetical protein P5D95_25390, partial [Vibrio parahaemolyticus]|nr:hypothetical protein [Vibrio parahaemolyticus]